MSSSYRQLKLTLPAEAWAVPVARRLVARVLTWWNLEQEDVDKAELVVGELAANAAQYGGAEVSVEAALDATANQLTLSVTDYGPRVRQQPARRCPAEERGRGLLLVESVAAWTQIQLTDDCGSVVAGVELSAFPQQHGQV